MMETLWQDIRYAARNLRASPGLVLVAALSLGVGIGANTTAFSWMRGLILRPLPGVAEAQGLVTVGWGLRGGWGSLSWPDYVDLRDATPSLRNLAVFSENQTEVRTGDETGRVWTQFVSGNYFESLGVTARLGRTFLPDEERNAAQVAVISHALWMRRFQGDSAVLGRQVAVNGQDVRIVGVAAPRFGGNVVALAYEMWLPGTIRPLITGRGRVDHRGHRSWRTLMPLPAGMTVAGLAAEADAAARSIQRQFGDTLADGARVMPYLESQEAYQLRTVLTAVLGVTFVVLLIACANVGSLLLARANARRREIGIRIAVGAARGRLVRQLLTESAVLAALSGAVGLVLAVWARDVHRFFVPSGPRPIEVAIAVDGGVMLFGLAVTVATVLLFGVFPALQASRPDVLAALKDEVGGRHLSRSRAQAALVSAQVALSLAALVAGGLFARSLANAESVETGLREPERLLLVDTDLTAAGYRDSTAAAIVERILERARTLPGVVAASYADYVPLGFDGPSAWGGLRPQGLEGPVGRETWALVASVGPDYFDAMGVTLVRGRGIEEGDRRESGRVAVVNEAYARRFWPGLDPVGRWIELSRPEARHTVVGVARDGRYSGLTGEGTSPFVYFPNSQLTSVEGTILVRTAGVPTALVGPLRGEIASLDANIPFRDPRTMTRQMSAVLYLQRIGATWLAGFGLVALFLASIGLYGLMSYSVAQRTREVGVRIALGAGRRAVVRLVVARAMRLTAVGAVAGLVLAAAAGFLLRSQLLGVGALDPEAFAAGVVLLAAVALLASWLPARRAARVDPVTALKSE